MIVKNNIIKQKANENGYTIRKLETIAGIKHGTLFNIINGRSKNPTAETLKKLANALNCSIYDLIGENETKVKTDTEEEVWYLDLYIECILYVAQESKTKKLILMKDKLLELTQEIYSYSVKSNQKEVDKNFANWILDKVFFRIK